MCPGLAEGALVCSPGVVGEVADWARMSDWAWIRTLTRQKKEELQSGERQGKGEKREEEKADFRRVVHTSQPECAPHGKNGGRRGGGARAPPVNRRGGPREGWPRMVLHIWPPGTAEVAPGGRCPPR